jgi:hypothetical protein
MRKPGEALALCLEDPMAQIIDFQAARLRKLTEQEEKETRRVGMQIAFLLAGAQQLGLLDEPQPEPAPAPERPRFVPAYCDPDNVVTGEHYTPGRYVDVRDIAKEIRQAIKAEHPEVKVSVRIERFAGGQAINIRIKEVAREGFELWERRCRWGNGTDMDWFHTPAAKELQEQLTALGNRWNRQNIDTMSDYFDVRYYLSVTFEAGPPRA